ncbi:MAG TPA: Sec-independent protein translocase protein TatB [Burkholderiales bacterium]|nr:Sec-independent protein translocase protein TatB [Burkholderiales bacterium]
MFDIGFSELFVIAVVALIVIGPERLPKVARTLGHLFGRMQRYVNDVKSDIAREMELGELKKMQSSMEDAARSFQSSVSKEMSDAEGELNKLTQDAEVAVGAHAGDVPAQPDPAVATAPQQRELALDANPPTPAQKQA